MCLAQSSCLGLCCPILLEPFFWLSLLGPLYLPPGELSPHPLNAGSSSIPSECHHAHFVPPDFSLNRSNVQMPAQMPHTALVSPQRVHHAQ